MILKTLGLNVLSALLPQVIDSATNWATETYDSVFGADKIEPKKRTRKKYDTTKITVDNAIYIRWYRANHNGTIEEHTAFLNKELGLNKSTYARIWHKDFDIDSLTKKED